MAQSSSTTQAKHLLEGLSGKIDQLLVIYFMYALVAVGVVSLMSSSDLVLDRPTLPGRLARKPLGNG